MIILFRWFDILKQNESFASAEKYEFISPSFQDQHMLAKVLIINLSFQMLSLFRLYSSCSWHHVWKRRLILSQLESQSLWLSTQNTHMQASACSSSMCFQWAAEGWVTLQLPLLTDNWSQLCRTKKVQNRTEVCEGIGSMETTLTAQWIKMFNLTFAFKNNF